MIMVYHGSGREVVKPDLSFSRPDLDFGRGFYLTPIRDQAVRWALRSLRRGNRAFLNRYRFDLESVAAAGYQFRDFPEYSEEWLEFIIANRSGKAIQGYDVVQGGVANDKVFNTIELYFDRLIDKSEALKRLKFEKPNHQICILNQEIVDRYLVFESAQEVFDGS